MTNGFTRQQAQKIANYNYQKGGLRYYIYRQNIATKFGSIIPFGFNNRLEAEKFIERKRNINDMLFIIDGEFK